MESTATAVPSHHGPPGKHGQAQEEAWRHEKLLFVINTEEDPQIEHKAIRMMLERRVEGILYASFYHRSITVPSNLREVPSVLVDCFAEPVCRLS